MSVIEVCKLTRRFGPLAAVDRLSFEVDVGTVVDFLGPNGAGKTTTWRMLLGLVESAEVSATIWGRPMIATSQRSASARKAMTRAGVAGCITRSPTARRTWP